MKAVFEKIQILNKKSITIFEIDKKYFDSHWHFHPEYELTYIANSKGIRYVGNDIQSFESGDLVLLGPNIPHSWKNHIDNTEPAKAIVIQWMPNILNDIYEFSFIKNLFEKSARGIKFDSNIATHCGNIMSKMITENPFQRYISLLKLLNKLATEKDYILLSDSTNKNKLSYKVSNKLDKILTFVEHNFQQKIRLKDIAELVFMTEPSFSRFFNQHMHRPFFEYLNEFRINTAARLLMETNKSVAEIAFLSGYETLPFFYKQFKKYKNHTPLAYRKSFQEIILRTS